MLTDLLVAVGLVWLLVLTVVLAGIVRYLGTMQAAGTMAAPEGGFLVDTDGPWIPSALPERVTASLHGHGIPTDDLVVAFFSPGCGSCLERASQVVPEVTEPAHTVFLMTGPDSEQRRALREVLKPTRAPILTDPDAHNMVKSLDINSTPFIFRVVKNEVVAKAYLRGVLDYRRVASAPGPESIKTAKPLGGVSSVPVGSGRDQQGGAG